MELENVLNEMPNKIYDLVVESINLKEKIVEKSIELKNLEVEKLVEITRHETDGKKTYSNDTLRQNALNEYKQSSTDFQTKESEIKKLELEERMLAAKIQLYNNMQSNAKALCYMIGE